MAEHPILEFEGDNHGIVLHHFCFWHLLFCHYLRVQPTLARGSSAQSAWDDNLAEILFHEDTSYRTQDSGSASAEWPPLPSYSLQVPRGEHVKHLLGWANGRI